MSPLPLARIFPSGENATDGQIPAGVVLGGTNLHEQDADTQQDNAEQRKLFHFRFSFSFRLPICFPQNHPAALLILSRFFFN